MKTIYTSGYCQGRIAYAVVNNASYDLGYGDANMAGVRALVIALASDDDSEPVTICTDNRYVMTALFKDKNLFMKQYAWWLLLNALLDGRIHPVNFDYISHQV